MKQTAVVVAALAALAGGVLAAQGAGAGQGQPPTLVAEVQQMYDRVQGFISRAAEQFPEEKYTWQPTPEVRSWARLIGHITDDNNGACWQIAGLAERPAGVDAPNSNDSAANRRTKAELVKGLADSAALCGRAFAAVTDATMMERAGARSKIGLLMYNTSHINEHYGNLVTYMRLQGMVPPSSQPRGRGAGPRR